MNALFFTGALIATFAGSHILHAQELEQPVKTNKTPRSVISAGAFGGIQTLTYQLTNKGVRSIGLSGGGGVGYAFHITRTLSVSAGAELSNYTASLVYNALSNQVYRNGGVRFNYSITEYWESQTALWLDVPILIRLTVPTGVGRHAIRFAGGVKFGLPANLQYTWSVKGHKTLSAILDYESMEYDFNAIFPPNTAAALPEQTGRLLLNTSIQLAAEVTYCLPVFAQSALSLSAYFSYGLNNIQNPKKKQLVTYSTADADLRNKPPQYTYNGSILNTAFASSIRTFALGLKLQLEWGL
ncbi:MAG: hypothetical protein LBF90_06905 [Prevotellaceae bacterium]|jgi:hypothetical protein|nr:hypothetical protein [Prevotellaceae bacterium]